MSGRTKQIQKGLAVKVPTDNNQKFIISDDAIGTNQIADNAVTVDKLDPSINFTAGINYISNPDAEANTNGWSAYDDAAQVPVDGTGGSPGLVLLTRSNLDANVLRGSFSFVMDKQSGDAQGQGVSTDFSIDNQDLGKRVNISFEYSFSSVTNLDSDSVKVYVYDVNNASMTELTSDNNPLFATTSRSKFTASFFADGTEKDYRLLIHVDTSVTDAFLLRFDNVQATPDTFIPGAIITEWQSFTPTGSWTVNTTYTGQYRRVGDSAEILYFVSLTGAPNAATLTIDMPTGLSIDTNKELTSATGHFVGIGWGVDSGTEEYLAQGAIAGNTFQIRGLETDGGPGNDVEEASLYTNTYPFNWTTNDSFSFRVTVPIEGWSAGALLSTTEANLTTVYAQASTVSGQAINSTTSVVNFEIVNSDNFGAITTGSGWNFKVPRTGTYYLSCALHPNAGVNQFNVDTFINGVRAERLIQQGDMTTAYMQNGSAVIELNKDDLIDFRCTTTSPSTLVLDADVNYITIKEIPDFNTFSVFGENEQIYAQSNDQAAASVSGFPYAGAAGNSITLTPGRWMLQASAFQRRTGAGNTRGIGLQLSESVNSSVPLGTGGNVIEITNDWSFVNTDYAMNWNSFTDWDQLQVNTSLIILDVLNEETLFALVNVTQNSTTNYSCETKILAIRLA